MKPKFKLILWMLLVLCKTNAQYNFNYKTLTDSVVKDGFYQLNLLPAIVAKCRPKLQDIRLLNVENKQIPYLIKDGSAITAQNNVAILQNQFNDYFPVPRPIIIQKDSSDKFSYINLVFKERYKINKIQLFISGTPFYERDILFKDGYYDIDKNQGTGVISSKSNNIFLLDLLLDNKSANTLKLIIANNDNPPLKIDSVKTYQNAYSLFAYLKADQKYILAFGNDSLGAPVYDIPAFSDSTKNALLLATNEITENKPAKKNSIKKTDPFNNKIWLWTVIIIVLLILLYFTSSLLKQINKK